MNSKRGCLAYHSRCYSYIVIRHRWTSYDWRDGVSKYVYLQPLKGPCATLILCGRAVLSERVNKPYMNCKQHEHIGKAMAANNYGSPVQRDL